MSRRKKKSRKGLEENGRVLESHRELKKGLNRDVKTNCSNNTRFRVGSLIIEEQKEENPVEETAVIEVSGTIYCSINSNVQQCAPSDLDDFVKDTNRFFSYEAVFKDIAESFSTYQKKGVKSVTVQCNNLRFCLQAEGVEIGSFVLHGSALANPAGETEMTSSCVERIQTLFENHFRDQLGFELKPLGAWEFGEKGIMTEVSSDQCFDDLKSRILSGETPRHRVSTIFMTYNDEEGRPHVIPCPLTSNVKSTEFDVNSENHVNTNVNSNSKTVTDCIFKQDRMLFKINKKSFFTPVMLGLSGEYSLCIKMGGILDASDYDECMQKIRMPLDDFKASIANFLREKVFIYSLQGFPVFNLSADVAIKLIINDEMVKHFPLAESVSLPPTGQWEKLEVWTNEVIQACENYLKSHLKPVIIEKRYAYEKAPTFFVESLREFKASQKKFMAFFETCFDHPDEAKNVLYRLEGIQELPKNSVEQKRQMEEWLQSLPPQAREPFCEFLNSSTVGLNRALARVLKDYGFMDSEGNYLMTSHDNMPGTVFPSARSPAAGH